MKNSQNITHICPGVDVKHIAYTRASVVLAILHYFLPQNKQSNGHLLYSMTSVVALFAYLIKLNTWTRNGVTKVLTGLSKSINKMLDKISFHEHFKELDRKLVAC